MNKLVFNSPAMDKILSRLTIIDSKIESIQRTNPFNGIWLNTKEAAQALGITTRTLQTYRDQGSISFSQFGREIRYRAEDIQEFLMSHYVKSIYQKGGIS